MRKWTFIIVIALIELLTGSARAADWQIPVLSDGDALEVALLRGPVGGWATLDEETLFGLGVIGLYPVAPQAELPLRQFFPVFGDWLNLPEKLLVDVDLGIKPGVTNLPKRTDFMVSPLVQISTGPLVIRLEHPIVAGGGLEGMTESGLKVSAGVCFQW